MATTPAWVYWVLAVAFGWLGGHNDGFLQAGQAYSDALAAFLGVYARS